MAGMGTATNDLVRLLTSGTLVGLSDGELLARFVRRRDEAAFSALVDRLGPMVLGTCRRRLSDPHDVEDAFQATFLILARRAHTLRDGDCLGAWLHGVARKVAARARSRSIRLRSREQPNPNALAIAPDTRPDDARDLLELVERELARLPASYRHAFELCCLDGLTQSEAARILLATPDQIRGRLERARVLLRERLAKQGILPETQRATVAPSLVLATTQFVLSQTSTTTVASILARKVLIAMLLHTFSPAAALLVSVGLTVSGAALLARAPVADDKKPETPAVAPKAGDFVKAAPGSPPEISVRGQIRPKNPEGVNVEIPGTTRILSIVEDQRRVKKGDVIVELDAKPSERLLQAQLNRRKQAQLAYEDAETEWKLADLAAKEDRASRDNEIRRLENQRLAVVAEYEAAKSRLDLTKKLKARLDDRIGKDSRTPLSDLVLQQDIADRVELVKVQIFRGQFAIEDAKAAWLMSQEMTSPRHRAIQEAAVRKARNRMAAAKKALNEEEMQYVKIEKRIEKTTVRAPKDGYIELANDPTRPSIPTIRPESIVVEGQQLFQVWDIAEGFTAEVKFPEAYVDRLKVGQKVNVAVDAMHGKSFDATVQSIAPRPDPTSTGEQSKVYTVNVNIDQPGEWLRPGMTTSNRFAVELDPERVKSIQARVPRTAVAKVGKTFQVAIRMANGTVEWRDVTLTDATDESAGIKSGLKPGEEVARDAVGLMTDQEREEKQASSIPTLAESLRNMREKLDARRGVSRATLDELKRLSPEQRETLMRSLADPQ